MREVLITGIGVVGPHGIGLAPLADAAASAHAAFSPWPADQDPPHPAASVGTVGDYPRERFFNERQLRLMDRAMSLSACAAGLALEDAGLLPGHALDGVGTFFGSRRAEAPSFLRFLTPILDGNPRRLKGADFPFIARNVSCGQTAIRFGLRGPSSMLASGPLSALEAIGRAADFVRRGRCEAALAGGFEVLSKFSLYLARHDYGEHLAAERPAFFGTRPGYLVPSEGACMLLLESADHAAARSPTVYARVDGWQSGRAGRGPWEQALADGLDRLRAATAPGAGGPGLVCAGSGGSSRRHETAERDWLASLVRGPGARALVCAPRSLAGEGESWSGALQVAAAAWALHRGEALPTRAVADDAPAAVRERAGGGAVQAPAALVSAMSPEGGYALVHLSRP